jgi:glycerol-3-phosphate cytidylyltransferase
MKKKIIYTTGVFDILHKGHINILVGAKKLGDYLVIGVQDDAGVLKSKGKYPVLSAQERVDQLEALPFVDKVFIYDNVDQRENLRKIKANVMVQGDDWEKTGDRTEIIEYLKQNNIRLVLIPYTKDISTTNIKKRVLCQGERNDKDFILNNVKLLRIKDLKLYEKFDETKVKKLVEKIKKEKVFFNPITINEYNIVIDGVNRLEAIKRLGAKFVPCLIVNYKDIDLNQNIHYVKDGKTTRISEFGIGEGEKIVFPKYSKEDIIRMVKNGEMVQNGATWHVVRSAVARLRIPLDDLMNGFDFEAFLKEKMNKGNIRYYPSNVYICDEWNS